MLNSRLRQEIQENGPLSQSRFMELSLQTYYATHDPLKDFTTAPEVSQMFGELIGLWALDLYEKLGSSPHIMLVELGPGKGTLMADIVRVAKVSSAFSNALEVHLVEISPLLKEIQKKFIHHPHVMWHENFEDIQASPNPIIVIANEFFDALPTNCYERKDNKVYERCIGMKEEKFSFVFNPLREEQGPNLLWEESPLACDLMQTINRRLLKQSGAFLCIDYGYEKGTGDTLQALFDGKPSHPLSHVGDSDMTCHVNFGQFKQVSTARGLGMMGPLPQGHFLKNLGLDKRLEMLKRHNPSQRATLEAAYTRLTHPQQMGTLFKAMTVFSPLSLTPLGFEP